VYEQLIWSWQVGIAGIEAHFRAVFSNQGQGRISIDSVPLVIELHLVEIAFFDANLEGCMSLCLLDSCDIVYHFI
jgi:hypothetical protein